METTNKRNVTAWLSRSPDIVFILWCSIAAFGAYFCMYAFRKPFNTGHYEGLHLFGMDYKSILIIAQVFGYMLSKFIGIKVIAELKRNQRIWLIIFLILMAGLSLLLFALVPFPSNFICLFLNGLPLGMIWGIVFSFLEGRRFTELLGFGLNISIIVASGVLKTIYFFIQQQIHISEFWMPFVVGGLFFPFFLLFVWMLSVIPVPNEKDRLLRTERIPMDKKARKHVMMLYGVGVVAVVIVYALLTVMRDFRDNFSVEIWDEIQPGYEGTVFATTEIISSIVVILSVGLIAFIRNNHKGFLCTLILMVFGVLLSGTSTLLFQLHYLNAYSWMMLLGIGLFLAYTPVQTVLFERIIGLFKLKANAGFFVYICDAVGYLGSVSLLLIKEFGLPGVRWSSVLIYFSYAITPICLLLLLTVFIFFMGKLPLKKKRTASYKADISFE
ncbi:DUF5690 family protein [Olivibacter sp. CPCC 100613]|uniref:DUF5690 family protein n=1 Tax=Olivibacter sp. CPCC 100613 TaxID=3079931 RepID=UPI002FF62871